MDNTLKRTMEWHPFPQETPERGTLVMIACTDNRVLQAIYQEMRQDDGYFADMVRKSPINEEVTHWALWPGHPASNEI